MGRVDNQPPRPGRKRSDDSRKAILVAALDLVGEVGFAGLTMERIATRSGTGKQTIYRWWPSKADVVLDALAAKVDLYIPIPDEGSYRADLRAFLTASFRLGRDGRVTQVLCMLMAHAQIDPAFGERFRTAFLSSRRDALASIQEHARDRGELPAGLSTGTAADIVFGVIWYRMLATQQPADDALVDELIHVLTH